MPTLRPASVIVASTFAAAMAATTVPTPLYPEYVDRFGLSDLDITIVYSAYGVAVMVSLVLFGRLSDHGGRKRPLGAALITGAAAMTAFLAAHGLGLLLVGRFLIGLTAGVYTGTATAWLIDLDTNRTRASAVAVAANLGGLGVGPVLAGALAQYGPAPLRLVYLVELALLTLGLIAHLFLPETVTGNRFHVDVTGLRLPRAVLPVFVPAAVAGIAAFGVSGVFGAVGPAMLRSTFDVSAPLAAGSLSSALLFAAAGGQLVGRLVTPAHALVYGCVGLALGTACLGLALSEEILAVLVVSSVVSGLAIGAIVGAGLGLLAQSAPRDRRGQVASAYFLAIYLGLVVPVVGFGLVETHLGLIHTGLLFSALVGTAALGAGAALARHRLT